MRTETCGSANESERERERKRDLACLSRAARCRAFQITTYFTFFSFPSFFLLLALSFIIVPVVPFNLHRALLFFQFRSPLRSGDGLSATEKERALLGIYLSFMAVLAALRFAVRCKSTILAAPLARFRALAFAPIVGSE